VNGAALMAFAAEWDGQEMGVMVLLEEQTDINVYWKMVEMMMML